MDNVAMTDNGRAATKIGAVNGLRGIAIIMVVMHHLFVNYASPHGSHAGAIDGTSLFAGFVTYAWLGVPIFFMLSGFVLYLPYCMGRRSMEHRADILDFYRHRALRLLPLYYIVVLVTMTLHANSAAGARAWYLELAALISTLYTFSPHGFYPPSNGVLWSISVEIWFSLLFPFFVLAIRRWPITRVVIATMVAGLAFTYVGGQIPIEPMGEFRPFTKGIFANCPLFLIGMLVCHLYVANCSNPVLRVRHSRLLLPGLCIVLMAFYAMWKDFPGDTESKSLAFNIGFSMLLLGVLSGENPLRWLLQSRPLQVLGCMCYSIYAWHAIMINEMIPPAADFGSMLRLLPPYFAVMLALSALSYRYIEFGRERNTKALFLIPEKPPLRLAGVAHPVSE